MGFGKKEAMALLSGNLQLLKKMAEKSGDKELLKNVEDQDKKLTEALGETKVIGPCYACKETETVSIKDYEYKLARWFMCPHKDLFCPDCLKKNFSEARKTRKAEKESKKKDDGKKSKK